LPSCRHPQVVFPCANINTDDILIDSMQHLRSTSSAT
jgi:hypothetical protein